MVGILLDIATGQLAIEQLQGVAGVILQGDAGLGGLLLIKIGIWGVGHQTVVVTVHIKVASRDLGIEAVKLVDLLALGTPARRVA